jgi:hypothetical protein
MRHGPTDIIVRLEADELADLAAIAAAEGVELAELAARMVREHLKPAEAEGRRQLDKRQRDLAATRLAIVREYQRRGRQEGIPAFIQRMERTHGVKAAHSTICNWALRYQAHGLPGLIDGRGQRAAAPSRFEPFTIILRRVLRQRRRPSLSVAYNQAKAEAEKSDVPVPSYRSACRAVQGLGLAKFDGQKGRSTMANQKGIEGGSTTH